MFIIKISWKEDIRRISCQALPPFAELYRIVQTLFSLPDNFKLKYVDEDNDLITISSDEEVQEAINTLISPNQSRKLIRLYVRADGDVADITCSNYLLSSSELSNSIFSNAISSSSIEDQQNKFQNKYPAVAQKFPAAAQEYPVPQPQPQPHSLSSSLYPQYERPFAADSYQLQQQLQQLQQLQEQQAKFQQLQQQQQQIQQQQHFHPDANLSNSLSQSVMENMRHKPLGTLGCRFVRDVQVPDGTVFQPGQKFKKIWLLKNSGSEAWPERSRLQIVSGDHLSSVNFVNVPSAQPGEDIAVEIDMTAPMCPGKYRSYYRMFLSNGVEFGNKVWVDIAVQEAAVSAYPEASAQLASLGFSDTAAVLKQYNGDLEKALNYLLNSN